MRNVLDNTIKGRTFYGLGIRQFSSVISIAHEDNMFHRKVSGKSDPEQLLRTIIYMLGLHLAFEGWCQIID